MAQNEIDPDTVAAHTPHGTQGQIFWHPELYFPYTF